MNTVRKFVGLVLVVAVTSFGIMGCNEKHEHPTPEPTSEEHLKSEQPSPEQPKAESPESENPTTEHPK